MGDSQYSFSLTTFSPTGKLVQIEHALTAVGSGQTSLGIKAANGVVIATEKKLPSILVDESSVQKIQNLTPNIGVVYSGMGPDFRVLVRKSRKQAEQYHRLYKEPIPVTQLVRETAAVMQEFTQSGGVRPFGVSLLVAGFDDKGPQLYQALARFRLCTLSQNGRRHAVTFIGRNDHTLSSVVSDFEPDELHDEGEAKQKDNALRLALTQLAGEFGRESMLSLQRFFSSRRASIISTGSLKLDLALGIGGLPKGRMVEIYGQEASGKTTIALHIIKEAQKLGGYCAFLDVENAMDHSLAKSMGVNTQNLLISRPDCAENLLSVVNTLTKSGSVDVIVVDSVAALVPQREIDTVVGGSFEDIQSRLMTQALRKINYSLCQSRTLIIFLNQVRTSLKSGRAEEVTCGGNALKFYSAVRLRMIRTGLLKTGDKVTGLGVCAQVVKNKLAPAMTKAEIGIQFGRGFCFESEVLELACEQSLIKKEGSSYVIGREVFSSEHAAEQYLIENEGVLDQIVAKLRGELLQRKM